MKLTRMIHKCCCKVRMSLKQKTPTILTCISAAGVVASVIMAVKATPKALELLEDAERERGGALTTTEKIVAAGRVYIPAATIGMGTIACIFGANMLNMRQQASMASAYALLAKSFNEQKNKVREICGRETCEEIQDSIERDRSIDVTDKKRLFYDQRSGRYFESTIEAVQAAEYHLNRNFILRGYAELNEFYGFLGIDKTDDGALNGWSLDCGAAFYGYSWIDFENELAVMDDGLECYIISMPFEPTADYLDY